MRSAKAFCPPALSQARFNASRDIVSEYQHLGTCQLKNMCGPDHRILGNDGTDGTVGYAKFMLPIDPKAFGARLRERREELGFTQGEVGERAGYSQQRVASIEDGHIKRPERAVVALAEAIYTSREWLCWGEGPRRVGSPVSTPRQIAESYSQLDDATKRSVMNFLAQSRRKNKIA